MQLAGAAGAQPSCPASTLGGPKGTPADQLFPQKRGVLLKGEVTYGNRWGEVLGRRPRSDRVDRTALPAFRQRRQRACWLLLVLLQPLPVLLPILPPGDAIIS